VKPVRDQIELRAVDIDSLIGQDHLARLIWAYVVALDLRELEDRIKAREYTPGHPPASPRLLLALWFTRPAKAWAVRGPWHGCAGATMRIVGSVGRVGEPSQLSDFRVGCTDLLDRLLAEHVRRWRRLG